MEIQRADPQARKRAAITVAVITLVGVLVIERARDDFLVWSSDAEILRNHVAYVWIVAAVVMVAPLLVLTVYCLWLARRVLATQRFPAPGASVIRDTPVLYGDAARRRGRLLQCLGAILALFAGAITLLLWRLAIGLAGPS